MFSKTHFEWDPFSIFLSFAINASMTNKFQMPKEIFQFPINIRELVDIYFQVHQCYIPMLDRVSLIRHVNYLQLLPEHKKRFDGW